MALRDIDPDTMWNFEDDTENELVRMIDNHLPEKWKKNRIQRRQIYRVVEAYLQTPSQLSTAEREQRARAKTLAEESEASTDRTIADATGRRLYPKTPYRKQFRRDLQRIERDTNDQ